MPLFSIASSRSWGIGEIGDLDAMTSWLAGAGQRLLQILPITETPPNDPSPYGALSAMAIDPQFITLAGIEDFVELGGEQAMDSRERETLERVRSCRSIDYRAVRVLKQAALRRAFERFRTTEWAYASNRARALQEFTIEQSWWLDDYSLFRALHVHHGERQWTEWPEPVRSRHQPALELARQTLAYEILFRQYLQWIADQQWTAARARSHGVWLFGDVPFVVSGDSADVWARQDEFGEGSVGVPPDAFSASGQDWGLPPYRWDVIQQRDFEWLRLRARRMAHLFDGCRVDHVVGFYRTFVRPRGGGAGVFTPAAQLSQTALGERVLEVFRSAGIAIVAEDLGTVPEFVRESLARVAVPGYKVFRWERHWHETGQPFRDPLEYPAVAVAASGTHDTEPMTIWWENARADERRAVLDTPSIRSRLNSIDINREAESLVLSPDMRRVLLEVLFASGADLLVLPIQDVFGWSDRINHPGTVSDDNWTWRLPWFVDRLSNEPVARSAAEELRRWSRSYGR